MAPASGRAEVLSTTAAGVRATRIGLAVYRVQFIRGWTAEIVAE
jgi:hypothetical protein